MAPQVDGTAAFLRPPSGRKINPSQIFAGQNVGIKEVAEKLWLLTFMHSNLGFFDQEAVRSASALDHVIEPVRPGGTFGRIVRRFKSCL